jgi:hypothetical protein
MYVVLAVGCKVDGCEKRKVKTGENGRKGQKK